MSENPADYDSLLDKPLWLLYSYAVAKIEAMEALDKEHETQEESGGLRELVAETGVAPEVMDSETSKVAQQAIKEKENARSSSSRVGT